MWHKYLQQIGGNAAEVSNVFMNMEKFEEESAQSDVEDIHLSQDELFMRGLMEDDMVEDSALQDDMYESLFDKENDSQSIQDNQSKKDADDPGNEDLQDFDKQ
eukprot:TRINITY_DN10383_c0_g1_i6.p3 TRINITY_DN10383_c0_g1~~TRINITY_DN10383_c0_g1_i6.p3  ORF type:complete len:103 (-),score=25.02 TRINITY_DN10383_c0_g1_i6:427-735(-)